MVMNTLKLLSNIYITNKNLLIFDPSISPKCWCSSNIELSNGKWSIYNDYYQNIFIIKNGYKTKIDFENWEVSTIDLATKSGILLFIDESKFDRKNIEVKNSSENFEFEINNIDKKYFFFIFTKEQKNNFTIHYQKNNDEIIALFIEKDTISLFEKKQGKKTK
jgi:hypothetical protein